MIWLNLTCERCNQSFDAVGRARRVCRPCVATRFQDNGGRAAHRAVRMAVSRGELAPAKNLLCTDCGKRAREYDHRDYSKPLEVTPVCRSCNHKRGSAIFNFASDAVKARYFAGNPKAVA